MVDRPEDHGAGGATPAAAARLGALPEPTRKLLFLAAGMGASFDLAALAVVGGRSKEAVAEELRPAIEAGLLTPATMGDPLRVPQTPPEHAFAIPVDEVYAQIPAGELPALHLRIGRRLLNHDGDPRGALEHIGRGARLLEIAHDEAQRQLSVQQRLASLGTLFAGVAHEIKNPLNFINNFAELSVTLAADLAADLAQVRGQLDPTSAASLDAILGDLVQSIGKIRAHGGRADAIVRSMLEQARGRVGQQRDADLNALVKAYALAAAQGRDEGMSPALEIALDDTVGRVRIVPEEIGRVVLNLVSNALYAAHARPHARRAESAVTMGTSPPSPAAMGTSPPNPVTMETSPPNPADAPLDAFVPSVRVSTEARGDHVEVRVRDNGVGIPKALRGRGFTPFFTTKPAGEGTGLGLSLSREIVVQSHGGSIAFESEDGAFTEFVVTLPRR
jgi:signal transduction histidine kinase